MEALQMYSHPGAVPEDFNSPTRIADSLYAVAFEMFTQERLRDAMDCFRAMVLFFPEDERSWLGLGHCHQAFGQNAVALELYSLCMVAQPKAVRTRIELARLLRLASRDADADLVLQQAEHLAEELDDPELARLVEHVRNVS